MRVRKWKPKSKMRSSKLGLRTSMEKLNGMIQEMTTVVVSHRNKICWKRERKRKEGRNHTRFYVLATADGNGVDVAADEQEDDCWEFWQMNVEFYDLVLVSCKSNPDVDDRVHEKDRTTDSESEDEGC